MATFNGVEYAKGVAVPSVKQGPGAFGDLRVFRDEYTTLAVLAASDVIHTGIVIPANHRVKQVQLVVPTNGGTVSVGIAGAATKYGSALAAGTNTSYPDSLTTVDEAIILTGASLATATGKYTIVIDAYKQ